jgi:ribosome silencing factor RsfS/YbeB/iojap
VKAIPFEPSNVPDAGATLAIVKESLENDKAIDTVVIDLAGKTTIADYMVVATGTSERHIVTMAEKLGERLRAAGLRELSVEGLRGARWVLLDAGDVVERHLRAALSHAAGPAAAEAEGLVPPGLTRPKEEEPEEQHHDHREGEHGDEAQGRLTDRWCLGVDVHLVGHKVVEQRLTNGIAGGRCSGGEARAVGKSASDLGLLPLDLGDFPLFCFF